MRKMNKVMAVALSFVLVGTLAACGGTGSETTVSTTTGANTTTEGDETGAAEGSLKTGYSIVTKIGSSKDAGDEEGLGQVDSTVIAVLVDADGKLVDIEIDAAQTKVNFDNTGKVTTDLTTEYKTKVELGDEYGLKGKSGIDKEWYEQMDALEELVIGKTSDEVAAMEMEDGKLVDATSSVTVTATGYITGIEAAMKNAQDLGAQAGDTIKLGIETTIGGSHDVGANERTPDAGKVEAYSFYSVLSVDAAGKITSAILDASQGTVAFDASGKITSDLEAAQASKNELGDDYNMKGNSGIGKEWNEQAAFFAESLKGKTVSDVNGIALDDGGHVTDADLLSGVTVHVNEMISVVNNALTR